MKFFLLLTFLLAAPFSPAMARKAPIVKDSAYFVANDGIQTPEEMEEEAQYVYGLCMSNGYQSLYFDCQCLSGAFLQTRERLGPTVLQNDILNTLTKSGKAVCANTTAIAGQSYEDCLSFANDSRELENDNEQYCTCAANKTATDFTKSPRLNIQYIRRLKTRALTYCAQPENRPAGTTVPRTVN